MDKIDQRLVELSIELPTPTKPVASYLPWIKSGNLVYVAGQLPMRDGKITFTRETSSGVDGPAAARLCAINILAQLRDACGGELDRVVRIVKVVGFVASNSQAVAIPQVVNGASDLFFEVFGERGKHARSSVGVNELPLNAAVEIEAIVEIA